MQAKKVHILLLCILLLLSHHVNRTKPQDELIVMNNDYNPCMDDEVVSDHYDSSLTVYIQGWNGIGSLQRCIPM